MERRRFLVASAAAVATTRKAVPAQKKSDKPLKVVVVGGHPGDPEYGCGGTVARYAERGDKVTLLYLNRGEKGCAKRSPQDCGDLRTAEAEEACRILGASAKFADQVDGESVIDGASYERFSALLQTEKPDVVLTHWPIDNHRDHRAAANLTYDAWLRAKKAYGLYFYEVSDGEDTVMFSPTDYVDIEKTEGKKRAACYAHASQSPDRFYALQREVTRFRGLERGVRQAEAFARHRESFRYLLP